MSRRSVASDPVEVVRDYLSRGVTGSLHTHDARGEWVLYVMQGEILAAHGPADGHLVIRRLLNGGAISPAQADHLLDEIQAGAALDTLLLGRVPEDLFLDLLVQRFRQDVLEFISCAEAPTWQPMEAVFVENIQTGHDSYDLLDGLRERRNRIAPLRNDAQRLLVRPGSKPPTQLMHARLLDLCEPEALVQRLVESSPFEDGVTLLALADMADQQVVEILDIEGLAPQVVASPAPPDAAAEPALVAEDDEPVSEPMLVPELDANPEEEATQELTPSEELVDLVDLADLDSGLLQPLSDVEAERDAQRALEAALADLPAEDPSEPSVPGGLPRSAAAAAWEASGPTLEPMPPFDLESDAATEEAPADLLPDAFPPPPSPEHPPLGLDDASDMDAIEELEDPGVEHAIRRAKEIEARRAAAREGLERDDDGVVTRPPGFDFDLPVPEDELAFFEDQDQTRGAGKGQFVTRQRLLDRVDLSDEGMAAFQRAVQLPTDSLAEDDMGPLAMGEASEDEARSAVALNFTGPRLDEDDIRRKFDVVNSVMAEIALALDEQKGRGSGRVSAQILVDGPPTRFAVLFRGVQVSDDGRMDIERLLRNLRKRPEAEHRRLVNEGLLDLIQRALSTSVEELDEERVDGMLERIAGYQQRLGL